MVQVNNTAGDVHLSFSNDNRQTLKASVDVPVASVCGSTSGNIGTATAFAAGTSTDVQSTSNECGGTDGVSGSVNKSISTDTSGTYSYHIGEILNVPYGERRYTINHEDPSKVLYQSTCEIHDRHFASLDKVIDVVDSDDDEESRASEESNYVEVFDGVFE